MWEEKKIYKTPVAHVFTVRLIQWQLITLPWAVSISAPHVSRHLWHEKATTAMCVLLLAAAVNQEKPSGLKQDIQFP